MVTNTEGKRKKKGKKRSRRGMIIYNVHVRGRERGKRIKHSPFHCLDPLNRKGRGASIPRIALSTWNPSHEKERKKGNDK